VIVVDNVVRDGAVVEPSLDDPHLQGIRRMNDLIVAEPRLDATAVQTVGIKGYDGFVIPSAFSIWLPKFHFETHYHSQTANPSCHQRHLVENRILLAGAL
jgi:hypothetical protein